MIIRLLRRSLGTMRVGQGRPQLSGWYSKSTSQICRKRSKSVGKAALLSDKRVRRRADDLIGETNLEKSAEMSRSGSHLRIRHIALCALQHVVALVLVPSGNLHEGTWLTLCGSTIFLLAAQFHPTARRKFVVSPFGR